MSEEEHQEEEGEGQLIQAPPPGGIHWAEDGLREADLTSSWVKKAEEEGAFSTDEAPSIKNLQTIWRSAIRQDLIEDLTEREALVMLVWWCGWNSGISYEKFSQRVRVASGLLGMAKGIMDDGPMGMQIIPMGTIEIEELEEGTEDDAPGDETS